ncbi:Outer membrane pore protein E precursor [Salmonella enterica subsp. enterica serovar Uganda str. R8-3404]|uniref:Outer membrane porin PhoE n=1 Tax=Salmonella enterica subsp. enterica serovar Uganda str. R8-3404 TaxID=913083 RepID=A0A6C8H8D3_SALET|nr:Outer membrane pore protein E precursor [Salmonella enterica subsp. enterica serovar Uganda str. R8-3404]
MEMNKSTLAIVVSIIASASVHAAEVYNKNGNKLDVYGKVKAMHYMSDYDSKDGDQSYVRFGFKGETQINDQLTGYGRWEAEFAGNKAESDSSQQKTRLAFAGLKLKDIGSFDYGRNLGALYDVEAWTDMFPEFGGDSLRHQAWQQVALRHQAWQQGYADSFTGSSLKSSDGSSASSIEISRSRSFS